MTENQSLGPLFEPGESSRIIDDALNAAAKKVGPLTRRSLLDKDEPPEPPDVGLASLVPHPCVVLILRHRGRGKTALACRLQELKRTSPHLMELGYPQRPPVFSPRGMDSPMTSRTYRPMRSSMSCTSTWLMWLWLSTINGRSPLDCSVRFPFRLPSAQLSTVSDVLTPPRRGYFNGRK